MTLLQCDVCAVYGHDVCPLVPGCACCDDTLLQMLDNAPAGRVR